MEILHMNNIVIVIIFVKTAKMLFLLVKTIYDIPLRKTNVIGLWTSIVKENRIICGKESKKTFVNVW